MGRKSARKVTAGKVVRGNAKRMASRVDPLVGRGTVERGVARACVDACSLDEEKLNQ